MSLKLTGITIDNNNCTITNKIKFLCFGFIQKHFVKSKSENSMWEGTGRFVLKFRVILLLILATSTGFMAWHASKVELSNEFSRAIPLDNIKYIQYQSFKQKFGEDGNLMVIGMQTDRLFT